MGENIRVQTFALEEGWNAIWVAVEPLNETPSAVFTNVPVDIAAVYEGVLTTRQFTSDPTADMLSALGWGIWYAPSRPDAFLTGLGAVHGQKAYLIHATEACTLSVEGTVELREALWQPGAFNLTGFCLDALAPPTFWQFFSSSRAHQACVVYRMVDGTWRRVIDPETEAMRSGEAFWIYCDGSSSYAGPLRVEMMGVEGVVLAGAGDEIVLRNETAHPLSPVLLHEASGSETVPMAVVVDVIDDALGGIKPLEIPMVSGTWTTILPTLESGGAARVLLAVQMEKMTEPEARTLLRIQTDIGTEIWIPVLGLRRDLE